MSQNTNTAAAPTSNAKVLPCVSAEHESAIVDNFRKLHHIVLQGLQTVGIKPLFNDTFAHCNNEDYKQLHQQARAMLTTAAKVRWDSYSAAITKAIQGVVDTHMEKARKAKERHDALLAACEDEEERALMPRFPNVVKVGLPALKGAFPEGKSDLDIQGELNKLFPGQVGTKAPKGQKEFKGEDVYVSFAFVAKKEEPKSEEVAPASTEAPKADTSAQEEPKADIAAAAE